MARFPLEILDLFIDTIFLSSPAILRGKDATLRICGLVSRSFYLRSRHHTFRTILIVNRKLRRNSKLRNILQYRYTNDIFPPLITCVKGVTILLQVRHTDLDPDVGAILTMLHGQIQGIESLKLECRLLKPMSLAQSDNRLCEAVVQLSQSASLRRLSLDNIDRIPASLLGGHLQHLSLRRLGTCEHSWSPPLGHTASTMPLPTLKSFSTDLSCRFTEAFSLVVDSASFPSPFRELKTLDLWFTSSGGWGSELRDILAASSNSLEDLQMRFDDLQEG